MSDRKKPLQVYLKVSERDKYNKICKELGISASEDLRSYINKQILKHKELSIWVKQVH